MRGTYPNTETYRALYARYHQGRSVEKLLIHLKPLIGTTVLDLCGGDGAASLFALQHGAKEVVLIDEAPQMLSREAQEDGRIKICHETVEHALHHMWLKRKQFHRVFCRQGFNYWCTEENLQLLTNTVATRGVLVFNTLNTKPDEKPRVRTYEMGGHHFTELSYSVGNIIHTVVARDGLEPHQSEILWMEPDRIRALLEPDFHLEVAHDGASTLYRCVRK